MRFSSIIYIAVMAFSRNGVFAQQAAGQNAITHPLGGTIDSTTPLKITWTPSTNGTITIDLLKGPPANLVDLGPIASKIDNSGSFTWNIPNSLQDSGDMPEGHRYGFRIIDDATGTYEYSPPFDISVPDSTFKEEGISSTATSKTVSATRKASTSTAAKSTSSVTSTSTPATTKSTTSPTPTSSTSSSFSSPLPTDADSATSSSVSSPAETITILAEATETPATQTTSQYPANTLASSSTTQAPAEPSQVNSLNQIPAIIGAAAGGFAAIGAAIVIVVLIRRFRRKSRSKKGFDEAMVDIERSTRNEHMRRGSVDYYNVHT